MKQEIKDKMLNVKNVGDLVNLDYEFETATNKEMLLFVSVDNYMNNVEIRKSEELGLIGVTVNEETLYTDSYTKVIVRTVGNRISYQFYMGGESLSIMPVVTIVP